MDCSQSLVLRLSPESSTSLRPKTTIPTGDDSLEMEISDLKFTDDEVVLSPIQSRVHEVC